MGYVWAADRVGVRAKPHHEVKKEVMPVHTHQMIAASSAPT